MPLCLLFLELAVISAWHEEVHKFLLQMIANTSSFKQCVKNNTLLSGRKHINKQKVRTTIHKLDPIAADGRNAIILSWTISSKLYHITTAESQTFYFS